MNNNNFNNNNQNTNFNNNNMNQGNNGFNNQDFNNQMNNNFNNNMNQGFNNQMNNGFNNQSFNNQMNNQFNNNMNQGFNNQMNNGFNNNMNSPFNNQFIQQNQNGVQAICSWPVIILAFIFFFPVGIFLLFLRSSTNRRETYTIWKRSAVIGWVLVVIGGLATLGLAFEPDVDGFGLIIAIVMLVAGIATLASSKKQKQKSNRYKMYVNLIVNSGVEDLSNIANQMNTTIAEVITDLNHMISKGYLGTFMIDANANRVYCPNRERMKQQEKERNTRIVICSNGCGASNIINTPIGRCEYCGSPIQ